MTPRDSSAETSSVPGRGPYRSPTYRITKVNIAWQLGGAPLIFVFCVFCVTCQRSHPSPSDSESSAVAVSGIASVAVQTAPQPPTQKPASGCAGRYQGTYSVAATKSGISHRDGAPPEWESDDGHALSGPGELALKVDNQNLVSGSAKGALGQQTARGSCDDSTLRVQLDAMSAEPGLIQNAFILADVSGDQATGTLTAASGDSLVRRSGTVNLRKSE